MVTHKKKDVMQTEGKRERVTQHGGGGVGEGVEGGGGGEGWGGGVPRLAEGRLSSDIQYLKQWVRQWGPSRYGGLIKI